MCIQLFSLNNDITDMLIFSKYIVYHVYYLSLASSHAKFCKLVLECHGQSIGVFDQMMVLHEFVQI